MMVERLLENPSQMAMIGSQACHGLDGLLEVPRCRSKWYFSKKEIEANSPSRKDGIDLMKENQLRAQYCSFLQELGMKLGMPQLTIATAMMFCHRFYLRQSHAKNDWQTMATVCLFLASKVEEPPCSLSKVITAAFEMIHRKDPTAIKRIQSKDVYEKQKDLITMGERMLLSTIEFDLEIQHPYKPLFAASKKLGIAENGVLRVAWNFVNDWLRTTLCLQYKPHYIAAGSIYLAAKLCKVKLPAEKDLVWWHEFDIMPQLFEEVKRQMMESFGYKRSPLAPCTMRKETPAPLEVHKEASCSPESCVLSRPGSAGSAGHDLLMEAGEVAVLRTACKDEARRHADHKLSSSLNPAGVQSISLQLRTEDSESPRERTPTTFGNVPECKGRDQKTSRTGWDSKGITNTDRERIRATLKRRRQEREVSGVKAPDSSSEDAWIERELECGLDLERGRVLVGKSVMFPKRAGGGILVLHVFLCSWSPSNKEEGGGKFLVELSKTSCCVVFTSLVRSFIVMQPSSVHDIDMGEHSSRMRALFFVWHLHLDMCKVYCI